MHFLNRQLAPGPCTGAGLLLLCLLICCTFHKSLAEEQEMLGSWFLPPPPQKTATFPFKLLWLKTTLRMRVFELRHSNFFSGRVKSNFYHSMKTFIINMKEYVAWIFDIGPLPRQFRTTEHKQIQVENQTHCQIEPFVSLNRVHEDKNKSSAQSTSFCSEDNGTSSFEKDNNTSSKRCLSDKERENFYATFGHSFLSETLDNTTMMLLDRLRSTLKEVENTSLGTFQYMATRILQQVHVTLERSNTISFETYRELMMLLARLVHLAVTGYPHLLNVFEIPTDMNKCGYGSTRECPTNIFVEMFQAAFGKAHQSYIYVHDEGDDFLLESIDNLHIIVVWLFVSMFSWIIICFFLIRKIKLLNRTIKNNTSISASTTPRIRSHQYHSNHANESSRSRINVIPQPLPASLLLLNECNELNQEVRDKIINLVVKSIEECMSASVTPVSRTRTECTPSRFEVKTSEQDEFNFVRSSLNLDDDENDNDNRNVNIEEREIDNTVNSNSSISSTSKSLSSSSAISRSAIHPRSSRTQSRSSGVLSREILRSSSSGASVSQRASTFSQQPTSRSSQSSLTNDNSNYNNKNNSFSSSFRPVSALLGYESLSSSSRGRRDSGTDTETHTTKKTSVPSSGTPSQRPLQHESNRRDNNDNDNESQSTVEEPVVPTRTAPQVQHQLPKKLHVSQGRGPVDTNKNSHKSIDAHGDGSHASSSSIHTESLGTAKVSNASIRTPSKGQHQPAKKLQISKRRTTTNSGNNNGINDHAGGSRALSSSRNFRTPVKGRETGSLTLPPNTTLHSMVLRSGRTPVRPSRNMRTPEDNDEE